MLRRVRALLVSIFMCVGFFSRNRLEMFGSRMQ